jgi:hypothetical protein
MHSPLSFHCAREIGDLLSIAHLGLDAREIDEKSKLKFIRCGIFKLICATLILTL